MADVLVWWLVSQLLGLAALPIAWRLFASLPDRGYALAKPLGIFLVSYVLWLLAMLGLVQNSRGTVIFILVILAALAWWVVLRRAPAATAAPAGEAAARAQRVSVGSGAARRKKATRRAENQSAPPAIVAWIKANLPIIAIEEAIFLVGLVVWAFFKAHNPEIVATEKPMELAFLNGILRSEHFPPLDPWLSGYSISYYYMGYLMMAVLTHLTGSAPTVAFNLMQVLNFALTLTGAFSIVYNLLARRAPRADGARPAGAAIGGGLLASFFVVIMGNLQGLLEFFYAHGMGSAAFWKWVGIADMTQPYTSGAWYPTTNWWWWKASRVIGTQGAFGDYTINEFPFFSFMLGDNHPHVLALPYGMLALALALSLLLRVPVDLSAFLRGREWTRLAAAWLPPALIFVGFLFLNTWDLPMCLAVATLAYAVPVVRARSTLDLEALKEIALFIVPVALLGVLLYLPFLINFQSQASGFGFVRIRSQLHHFLIIFAPFLFMTAGFLAIKVQEWRSWPAERRGDGRHWLAPLVVAGVIVIAGLLALQLWTTVTTLLMASLSGVLVSIMLVVVIFVALFAFVAHSKADLSDVFALILIGVGCAVALAPEWLHIKDTFGGATVRMNTVFKFLYQAWILLALASAYAFSAVLGQRPAGRRITFSLPRAVYVVVAVALMAAASFYPVMAFYTKANQFQGVATLDGMAYMQASAPDDYDAILWLNKNIPDAPVVLESVGGQYSEYARVSAHTGLPTVLGWPGHEVQWRGDAKGWETREADVNRIYATTDVNEAMNLLRTYGVTYVYVGGLERNARTPDNRPRYHATALGKFATFMDVVYQKGSVTIYRMR